MRKVPGALIYTACNITDDVAQVPEIVIPAPADHVVSTHSMIGIFALCLYILQVIFSVVSSIVDLFFSSGLAASAFLGW